MYMNVVAVYCDEKIRDTPRDLQHGINDEFTFSGSFYDLSE